MFHGYPDKSYSFVKNVHFFTEKNSDHKVAAEYVCHSTDIQMSPLWTISH